MSKIKAAIACKNPDTIQYVYGTERLELLKELTDLNPVMMTEKKCRRRLFRRYGSDLLQLGNARSDR